MRSPDRRQGQFYRHHLLYPLIVWLAAIALLQWLHVDFLIADWLYALEGGTWVLRDHWLVQGILHSGAQDLVRVVGIIIILAIVLSAWLEPLRRQRRALLYLFAATLSSTILIALFKKFSGVPCTWNVARYGGTEAYASIWSWSQLDHSRGGCFPSGHAAVGYAWTAVYFLCLSIAPRWRWAGLAGAIILGLVFGFAQQLRGAHFLSHDLWSLAICWMSSLLCYVGMFGAGRAITETIDIK